MNITANGTFEALKEYMVKNHNAKIVSGGKEITKRCHICGDSRDPSSRHMYIGITKDGIIAYNCFKCGASGIVNTEFFREMGNIYDTEIIQMCHKYNQSNTNYTNSVNRKRYLKNFVPKLVYRDAPETDKKLAYLYNRLGVAFNPEELASNKIVLNLGDYIQANQIDRLTRHETIVKQLDQFYLGFLSNNNTSINLRRLVPENKVYKSISQRYIKYSIYDNIDDSGFYFIPTIALPSKIRIHIAEGPFDILGVYYNTDSYKLNSVFAAIGGKSYLRLIKYFVFEYGIIDFELHIYVDNDIDQHEMIKIAQFLYPFRNDIYVHRNTFPGEKDFGVRRDHIIDSITKL